MISTLRLRRKEHVLILTIDASLHSFLDRGFKDGTLPPHLYHPPDFLLNVI
jgi:hypothetical protein